MAMRQIVMWFTPFNKELERTPVKAIISGFFIKRSAQKKAGFYDTRYHCSADYDLFYKLIVKFKMKGMITKKNETISKFDTSGYSSKLSLFEHMIEETNIRINNKQNKIIVLIMFVLKFLKHYFKI